MELINNGQITPHRLHAMVRLISRLKQPKKKDLFDLLQPTELIKNQDAANSIFTAAKQHNLLFEQEIDKVVVLHPDIGQPENIESVEDFRSYMRKILLGIVQENEDNYRFNIFTAWYAVQDEKPLQKHKRDLINQFNAELYPHDADSGSEQGRAFNEVKFNAWSNWAIFLGFGWNSITSAIGLIPDAHDYLLTILSEILTIDDGLIPFGTFAARLAKKCPELDGGVLFEKSWQASRGTKVRGNRLSLMTSTGLRTLHQTQHINLTLQRDSTDVWSLYPAEGHPLNKITHIQLRG